MPGSPERRDTRAGETLGTGLGHLRPRLGSFPAMARGGSPMRMITVSSLSRRASRHLGAPSQYLPRNVRWQGNSLRTRYEVRASDEDALVEGIRRHASEAHDIAFSIELARK